MNSIVTLVIWVMVSGHAQILPLDPRVATFKDMDRCTMAKFQIVEDLSAQVIRADCEAEL